MTFQDDRDLNEMARRSIRAGEGNKVALWLVLGAVGAAIVAAAISATSYIGTPAAPQPPLVATGLAGESAPVTVPLPVPRPAQQ